MECSRLFDINKVLGNTILPVLKINKPIGVIGPYLLLKQSSDVKLGFFQLRGVIECFYYMLRT